MQKCPKCSHVAGTHDASCPLNNGVVEDLEMAEQVLDAIGGMLPDAELSAYQPGSDRWLAIQNHVGELVRQRDRLHHRNTELERRLLDVARAVKGIRIEEES